MIHFTRKKAALIFGTLIFLAGLFFIVRWKSLTSEPIVQNTVSTEPRVTAFNHEILRVTDDAQVVRSNACDFTFQIPRDWMVSGIQGETKILSPEDERKNQEWYRAHEEAIQNTEGEATGLDGRSLSVSCQESLKNYLDRFSMSPYYKNFEYTEHLVEALATNAFRAKDSDLALLKTINIDGEDAYEISWIVKMPDGTSNTTYEILVERNGIFQIHLGQTPYEDLSDRVKHIIQSISFED